MEGLPGVLGEQGNRVILTMGTREQRKKIMRNKGTQNILGNRGTEPLHSFTHWSLLHRTQNIMTQHIVDKIYAYYIIVIISSDFRKFFACLSLITSNL
jgi:hypothetical protein